MPGLIVLFLLTAFFSLSAPDPLSAGSMPISTLVLEGDVIAGVGAVTRIDNVAVNNGGQWLVEADTDHADTDADQVLIRNGSLYLREGQNLPLPVGAQLNTFDSINLNDSQESAWNFFLSGTSGSSDDSGIYFNTQLVIQESDVSTAPQFSAGTPYIGFFDVKYNNNNLMMTVASVDDPGIVSSVDRAIVRILTDGAGGIIAESVVAKEGDLYPGETERVQDFGTGPHQSALDDAGNVMFFADLTGSTASDGTIWVDLLAGPTVLLAHEGRPSPVAGRNYEILSSRSLDLSSNGHYVFKANLDGSTSDDDVIVRDGTVFMQEGSTFPDIAPYQITSFGSSSAPVKVHENGGVFWYGAWNDPNTGQDTGLFLDSTLVVQEGVTIIDGLAVQSISSITDGFESADTSVWACFEATLSGGIEGAFLIELSPSTSVAGPAEILPITSIRSMPNPFTSETVVRYSLTSMEKTELKVFDIRGRLVTTLHEGIQSPGPHMETWNGTNGAGRSVSAGTYFIRLFAGETSSVHRVVLVK